MGTDDLKLVELFKLSTQHIFTVPEVKTVGLQDVASAYVANMGRVKGLLLMPTRIWLNASIVVRAVDEAYLHVTQKLGPVVPKTPNSELAIYHDVQDYAVKRWFEIEREIAADGELESATAARACEAIQWQIGSEFTRESFQPWLASLVIGSWTAYEVLATDLWVKAVNIRPKSLGKNAWTGVRFGESEGDDSKAAVRHFSLDLLDEYDFDLSHSMGTMLWRKRHYDFNTLKGLAEAYKRAFRVQNKDGKSALPPEVRGWFSGDDYTALGTLEKIRHVAVHRGSRADLSFLDRMTDHPTYGRLGVGDPIPLDGEAVAQLTRAAVECGARLLTGVDNWLTTNTA